MIGFTGDQPRTHSNLLARPREARTSLSDVPVPVAMLLIAMLLPGEFDFNVGTLRLNCARIVLAIWLPIALTRFMSFRSFDYLFLAAFIYYASTLFIKEPFDKALATGGIV